MTLKEKGNGREERTRQIDVRNLFRLRTSGDRLPVGFGGSDCRPSQKITYQEGPVELLAHSQGIAKNYKGFRVVWKKKGGFEIIEPKNIESDLRPLGGAPSELMCMELEQQDAVAKLNFIHNVRKAAETREDVAQFLKENPEFGNTAQTSSK